MVKTTRMVAVRLRTQEARSAALSPCARCIASEKAEMAGEWLKAKTSTGIISQVVISRPPPPPLGSWVRSPMCQVGISIREMMNRAAISGYTRNWVTASMIFSPAIITAIIRAMSTKERIGRGTCGRPSWLTISESMVLVMDTP